VNIKVVLEYDGSGFAGWQQQAHGRTVEAELKQALRQITGKDLTVYAAGRTDAGAHAEGQVVNFHTDGRIAPQRLIAALNAKLADDVAALSAEVRVLVAGLDEIRGVGGARKKALLRRFGSVAEIRRSSLEEIDAVAGIGPKLAASIKSQVGGA